MTGRVSYEAGLAAEHQVARTYAAAGREILDQRWRGVGGEIDLIARDGLETVFIEVKKSRTHAEAASHLRPRQVARLLSAASEYMGMLPDGQNSCVRFDVALVDEQGRIDILENALAA